MAGGKLNLACRPWCRHSDHSAEQVRSSAVLEEDCTSSGQDTWLPACEGSNMLAQCLMFEARTHEDPEMQLSRLEQPSAGLYAE